MRSYVYRYVILLAILLAGLCVDLYTKEWARDSLQHGPNREILGGLVELGYTGEEAMAEARRCQRCDVDQ